MAKNDSNYLSDDQLEAYIKGTDNDTKAEINRTVSKIMTTKTNGIEALPYQFMKTVDRRVTGTSGAGVGRKYAEKIFSRLPLLFITPCEPLFMDDFKKDDRTAVLNELMGNKATNLGEFLTSSGRYYSVDFAYSDYYNYLNTMLAAISMYLGIANEKISIGNQSKREICKIDWRKELNSSFKTFFSSQENVIFYLDGMNSVSESMSNDTTESSLASSINGIADQANEIKFLFGNSDNVIGALANSADEATTSITQGVGEMFSTLGGGIVSSLASKGVNSVLNGGKIIFPEIWSGSHFDRSYTIDIKLRSPDHDSLSIFLNILKPYCKILSLVMPRQGTYQEEWDPNAFRSPFLVKAYSKGLFNVDMGIISSMSVTKGAECCWNDDGLPTQIDISIEIKDLYSNLAMSSMWNNDNLFKSLKSMKGLIANTAYMDFLANMAGLNIAQMEIGRRITLIYYLAKTMSATAGSTLFSKFDQGASRLINKMYNIL